jgi:PAS domain S-box-containing protein
MHGLLSDTWPFHQLPIPVFQTDGEGRILHANRHWLNLLSVDAANVRGRLLTSFMTEAARERHKRTTYEAAGELCEIDSEFATGDGGSLSVSLSYSIERNETGAVTGMLGTVVDQTSRRTAQNEAARNAALFESVFAHANDAILITEAEPIEAPDGPRILFVNTAFTAMTGYTAAEAIGKTPRILQGPRTDRRELDRLHDALKAWKPVRVELVNYAKNGAEFTVEIDITPVARPDGYFTHWVAIQRDITARRELETQRLKTIVDSVPQLMWRATRDGKCAWTSPQWYILTGQKLEESLGRGWMDVINPDDRPVALKSWRNAQREGVVDFESRLYRASDGAYIWHRVRGTAVRDANGEIVEWIGTSTDIHEFKDMQQLQNVLLGELQHRTRNLLAVVQAVSGKTMRRSATLQEFATKFDSRLSALSRMQGLLARNNTDMLDLRQLVELELDSHLDPTHGKVEIAGPTVRVGASSGRTLILALHELAANAVRHGALGQPEGKLEIGWEVADRDGARQLSFQWRETGVVMPQGAENDGFGFGREILERALPYDLNASTQFHFGSDGVRCNIQIPLSSNRGKHG